VKSESRQGAVTSRIIERCVMRGKAVREKDAKIKRVVQRHNIPPR
jgi:hypothetical protein